MECICNEMCALDAREREKEINETPGCNESFAPIWLRVTASIVINHLINIPCNYRFCVWNKMDAESLDRECRIEISFRVPRTFLRVSNNDIVWSCELNRIRHTLHVKREHLLFESLMRRRFGVCSGVDFSAFFDQFSGCCVYTGWLAEHTQHVDVLHAFHVPL